MTIKWTDPAARKLQQEIVKGLIEEFRNHEMYKKVEKEYKNEEKH